LISLRSRRQGDLGCVSIDRLLDAAQQANARRLSDLPIQGGDGESGQRD
jgi:hypothetical protein